jgi:hypothetical protein
MTTSKRKIKAQPFIRDLRQGMGDWELMERYGLSNTQLRKVFQRLVDAGAIDEMELFMRTSLTDSLVSRAFVESRGAVRELADFDEVTPPGDLETPSYVEVTERLSTKSTVFDRLFSKLGRAE